MHLFEPENTEFRVILTGEIDSLKLMYIPIHQALCQKIGDPVDKNMVLEKQQSHMNKPIWCSAQGAPKR